MVKGMRTIHRPWRSHDAIVVHRHTQSCRPSKYRHGCRTAIISKYEFNNYMSAYAVVNNMQYHIQELRQLAGVHIHNPYGENI